MLKQAMTITLTLAMPTFNESFIIEIDASGDGIEALRTQQDRPIAFISRALRVTKQAWSIYTREMQAIMEEIWTWRPYLLGRNFFIQTKQWILKYFLDQCVETPE